MSARILVVDDDPAIGKLARTLLQGDAVHFAGDASAALAALAENDFDVMVTDLEMPGIDGLELCAEVVTQRPDLPVIVLTAHGSYERAVGAVRVGAYDFLTKPIERAPLRLAVERAVAHRRLRGELKRLRQIVDAPVEGLHGESRLICEVRALIGRVAASEATILIRGETGTGKEVAARAIHRSSSRAGGPFVALNCAAIPEALLESELFGHVRGAFTDARANKPGLFARASGGTLFLDEIGELPIAIQPKLLRVLQERVVRALGATEEAPIDVRIVAATNVDLETAIVEKRFREDLYFRLNVLSVELPPLRSRGGDVLTLAARFLAEIAVRARKPVKEISAPAAERLLSYPWPGNVRELFNCIERAVALAQFDQVLLEDLPDRVRTHSSRHVVVASDDPRELVSMAEVERRYIERVLEAVAGNKTEAARILGFNRATLYRKLEELRRNGNG